MTRRRLQQLLQLRREIEDIRRQVVERKRREQAFSGWLGVYNLCDNMEFDVLTARLRRQEDRLAAELYALERYVEGIEDSVTRRVFRMRYIEGLSWGAIGQRCYYAGEEGPRMAHDRFLRQGNLRK